MIEVPSAAIMSDELAKKVGFFSIGSNDLIQYTLAVDRGNQAVANYYDAFSPAVLRLVKMVIDNGHKNNIRVSVCGEMAGEPNISILLIGMGIDELSVNPASILKIKKVIRNIRFQDALEIADKALKMTKSSEIKAYIAGRLNEMILIKDREA
jgi:phosphotransferase system enzyme I (PtsI)